MSASCQNELPIIICGGGIAGLTLALTLAEAGYATQVLEARAQPDTAGAGIQLGPNATRILRDLGVAEILAPAAVTPDAIVVANAKSGNQIARLPLGKWLDERHGAPYWVVHRADLQDALITCARQQPLIALRLGCRVHSIIDEETSVTAACDDGEQIIGRLLVGADGLWSTVRSVLHPDATLAYSGMTAARALLDADQLPAALTGCATHVWLAPDSHIVMYPVRSGNQVALVVITSGKQPEQGWGIPVESETFLGRFAAINTDLRATLARASDWQQWALFDPAPITSLWQGRKILIGDSAHPILPFLAQGGAMAIEDAYVLGHLLARHGVKPELVGGAFAAQRNQRVKQVQHASRQNGRIYHLGGISAKARDLAMRVAPSRRFIQRYDWIYGWRYDPTGAQ